MTRFGKNSPIGFFDSGVGGLSVYSRFKKVLPNENTLYFGDLAHLFPYIPEYKHFTELCMKRSTKHIALRHRLCYDRNDVVILSFPRMAKRRMDDRFSGQHDFEEAPL